MKLEDMTRAQLIHEIKSQWATIDQLKFSNEQAWARYENSNGMAKSYMKEFADRGLIYIPKIQNEQAN